MTEAAAYQGTYLNIPAFDLHRPASIAEACELAAAFEGNCRFMGGGVDLMQQLKSGAAPGNLIYLKSVPELSAISTGEGIMRVGACVTHHDIEGNPVIAEHAPALAGVWGDIANIRIRIAGTIGGNVLARHPDYDGLPALIALDGAAWFDGPLGQRRVHVRDIAGTPPLGLLTAIEIPSRPTGRFVMDRSLKPVVSVAVSADIADGGAENICAGIGCAFPAPAGGPVDTGGRISTADLAAQADELAQEFAGALPDPVDNFVASGAYRRRMIAALLGRGLRALAEG